MSVTAERPSSAPRSRIDYLLHAGGMEPVEADVVPSAVSDHSAVRIVYELPTQADEHRTVFAVWLKTRRVPAVAPMLRLLEEGAAARLRPSRD